MTLAPRAQPLVLIRIAAASVLSGALLGAVTNAVNGLVSPDYFRNIMHWDDVQDIWRAAIAQGVFEGLTYGVLFSLVFTTVAGVVSQARCSFDLAARYLLLAVSTVGCCWLLGGLAAMGLATLSPEFYRRAIIGVPEQFGPMLRYAWVGGSIQGGLAGGLLGLALSAILFRARWRELGEGRPD